MCVVIATQLRSRLGFPFWELTGKDFHFVTVPDAAVSQTEYRHS